MASQLHSEELSNPRVELALDSIGRQFGEQVGMPDSIKSSNYVQRNGPDLMSDIEGLHPLLGKWKQHVQGRVTGVSRQGPRLHPRRVGRRQARCQGSVLKGTYELDGGAQL